MAGTRPVPVQEDGAFIRCQPGEGTALWPKSFGNHSFKKRQQIVSANPLRTPSASGIRKLSSSGSAVGWEMNSLSSTVSTEPTPLQQEQRPAAWERDRLAEPAASGATAGIETRDQGDASESFQGHVVDRL